MRKRVIAGPETVAGDLGAPPSADGAPHRFQRMQFEPGTDLHELAGQFTIHSALHLPRHRGQGFEIDAGVVSAFMKQVDQVLGADVAGGAPREWAAA